MLTTSLATLLLVTSTTSAAYDPVSLAEEFADWKLSRAGQLAKAQGLYRGSADSELLRFYNTKMEIARLNAAHPNAHFSLDSPFTLLTTQEFVAFVKSNKPATAAAPGATEAPPTPSGTLPVTVDWTASNCVNGVQQQGQCGSCWAFATVMAVESAMCLASPTKTLLKLSEQQLTSCDKATDNQGCQGGFPSKALEYVAAHGLCQRKDYPYVSGDSGQDEECTASKCTAVVPKSLRVVAVPSGQAHLQAAVERQPVIVGVAAGNNEWKQYKSGTLSSCSTEDLDHAVVVVGYGVDAANNPIWRIQNSWGTAWGNHGFMQLHRGTTGNGTCGLATEACFPSLQ
ncbi:cysteine protease family C01A [Achlya hypogyna]|uniref:Cysteine protease family C01A n=1 Tax=Achlya hypogyna TaxID=1202772 RepID=A0A1V9YZG1_ACHHY|nr:cysteine protease family C01A [Achlya hypogyna]